MGVKTYPEQAKRRRSRLSAVPIGGDVFTFRADVRERVLAEVLPTG
jgi:hypothetical protein